MNNLTPEQLADIDFLHNTVLNPYNYDTTDYWRYHFRIIDLELAAELSKEWGLWNKVKK